MALNGPTQGPTTHGLTPVTRRMRSKRRVDVANQYSLHRRVFLDIEMPYAGHVRHVDVLEVATELRSFVDSVTYPGGDVEIDVAVNVTRCRRAGKTRVKANSEFDRNALLAELSANTGDGVGARGVTDQDDRSDLAALVFLSGLI